MRWRRIRFPKRATATPLDRALQQANGHDLAIDAEALKPHPILSCLPHRTLARLLAKPAFSEYPKGTVVFREGDPCDAIYLIISGRCEGRVGGATTVEEVFGSTLR